MASMVKRYGSTTSAVTVRLLAMSEIMSDLGLRSIDLIKVDVEGYEAAVVEGLMELIHARRMRALLLDYDHRILAETKGGIPAKEIHASLLRAGMIP
jgi:hypothetical protein